MRTSLLAIMVAVSALAGGPASAQTADPYAFCYADPPTYRSGHFVYTRVRLVGTGAIDLFEVAKALSETSPQVQGRQVSCWRYPTEPIAEAKRQEGMARDRSRGYVVLESEWQPSRVASAPAAAAPLPAAATIVASPVPDTPPPSVAAAPPAATPSADSVAADIDRVTRNETAAPAPVPDPETGAVANLNAGIVAAEAARINAAAQAQAAYQQQLAEHARQVAEVRARNAKAQADYEAAVKACAAGDFSKCGGPPVPVKRN